MDDMFYSYQMHIVYGYYKVCSVFLEAASYFHVFREK